MIEVLFPDEQTPTPLTQPELDMRKALAGRKLRNGRWDYTDAFRRRCAELRGEWAWAQERMRGPRR